MNVSEATEQDRRFMDRAYEQARKSFDEGGLPIGAVLVRGSDVLAEGHNRRVQDGDPIAHGEMDCIRKAGRQKSYRDTTLYTTLSPCMMCAGTIVQFGMPRLVIGEATTFEGNIPFLEQREVVVILLNDRRCIELMTRLKEEKPDLWNEDIGE